MKSSAGYGNRDPHYDDLMWEAIRKIDRFYDRLELMPGAKELFDLVYGTCGDRCEILTGIPREERGIVTAAEDKLNWIRRVLSDQVTVHTVIRKQKVDYCKGSDYILIDDLEKTILEWRNAGGTGILHTDSASTLKQLRQLGAL